MPGDLTRRSWLTCLGLGSLGFAQGATPVSDPLKTLVRTHPRLIASDADLERIRALIRENALARKLYTGLTRDADKLIAAPPPDPKHEPPRLTGRRLLDRIYTLGLLFRLDAKPAYLEQALKDLRAAAALPMWHRSFFAEAAETTHAFAIAYDWLFVSLAPSDRSLFVDAMVQKGLQPAAVAYNEPAGWVTATHAGNLVCNCGVALGALAVAEEVPDLATRILNQMLSSVPRAAADYAPDGSRPDGPTAWHWATRALALLIAGLDTALESDFGLSNQRGLDRAGRFQLYISGPTGRSFNYAESTEDPGATPELFWLARRYRQNVLAWTEQREAEREQHPAPLDLIWFFKEARSPAAENWPLDAIFPNAEVATLRTSWDDPNALFVAVKAGDNKLEHAHLDLGSFVLDAGGVRWALDLGADDSAAAGRGRFASFKTRTESHNTLLIDGENQSPRGDGRIARHEFGADLSWVELDLTGAYAGKLKQWRRRVGLAQRHAVLVHDQITTEQPVEVLWAMMTGADVTFKGQTAELVKDGWNLTAEIHSPRHAVFDVVTSGSTKRLVVRLGMKVTDLDLNIILTPWKAGQTKPKTTVRFPA